MHAVKAPRGGFQLLLQRWRPLVCGMIVVFMGVMLPGCGSASPAGKVLVTGTVTVAGEPLNRGIINFGSADGTSAMGSSSISPQGVFSVHLRPGHYKVAILDPQAGMRPPETAGGKPTFVKSVVPSRYESANTSGLTLTAAADGNPVAFALD